MRRAWCSIKRSESTPRKSHGFSLVEVLLASTLFSMITVALIGAIIYGRASTANSGDRARAVLLAQEGIEAVRNIRDANFNNLTNGTFGLVQSGNVWTLAGGSDTSGIYTRQITISAVDGNRKLVTAQVSWPQQTGSGQVSIQSRLTNWMAAIIPPTTPGPIMMAYSKTSTTPFYRTWDGTTWSAEGSAQTVVGNINYIVLKSSRTRNEAVLGIQTSTGAIYFQVWNGTTWGNLAQIGTGPTTTRSFDLAYEKNSDRAVIAYTPSSGSADFAYRTWNGTTLSAATNVTSSPTTGAINWIELRQNPLAASNDIAMILLDASADVYGMRWTGSAWSNMGVATTWDTTASNATRKGIDVEYEQTSGDILFAWGDATSTDNYYRTWNGTTLSNATLLDISTAGGVTNWLQLAGRPASNEIILGVQDAGADLNTRKWSGSAWDTGTQHPEHDPSTENVSSRNFDLIWETHPSNPGKAWLVWGNGSSRSQRLWSGTAWGTIENVSGSDDTSFVRLRADGSSGAVFSGIYQSSSSGGNNRDINERHLTNGSSTWSDSNAVWGGPTTTDPVYFRIDIATP